MVGFSLCGLSGVCVGQQYPSKSIRMIVPYSPGGGSDVVGRIIAQGLTQNLGQQVIIDNRDGRGGSLGAALAAKSPADGYTLLLADVGTMAVNPWIFKNAGYNPLKDLTPVAMATSQPNLFAASLQAPVASLKDVAALGKEKPGQLTFAYSAATNQMGGRLFEMLSGAKLTFVAYKGGAPAVAAIAGGHVDLMMAGPTVFAPMIKAGKVRVLAVTGPQRLASLPDIPTSHEQGFPAYDVAGWYSVAAPAGTPRDAINKLNSEIARVLASPAALERFAGLGLQPKPTSVAETAQYVKSEYERWGKVVQASGITPE